MTNNGPRTPLIDLRAPGALLQYAADLARAHAGALTHQPVKVVAIQRRRLRLVKDSAPGIQWALDPGASGEASGVGNEPGTGAECVVCDDRGCEFCRKVGA